MKRARGGISTRAKLWAVALAVTVVVAANAGTLAQTLSPIPDAPAPAATPPPRAVDSSPGCHALVEAARGALPRKTVEAPAQSLPFFAARAGVLPANGAATVGGLRLPHGSRCLRYWAADRPVRDARTIASRLAAVFPRTGLWPVLWTSPGDGPDEYMTGAGNPEAAQRLDVESVLRRSWAGFEDNRSRFPGLAPGSEIADRAVHADPFAVLTRPSTVYEQPSETELTLMLVPCNRPGDVLSVLGPQITEVMSDDALTAVLRSWEERFGAVITTLGPGTLGLAVEAPPRNVSQATRLAAEQVAFAPEDDTGAAPNALGGLARQLLGAGPSGTGRSRDIWQFGWPD